MARLTWNQYGDRRYESGVDRGVLYLPRPISDDDDTLVLQGVPWNGLTSVVEKTSATSEPIYFGGRKIGEVIAIGAFTATLGAVMCPDEFFECEGLGVLRRGGWVGQQKPKPFGLSWRTMLNDDRGREYYKIHVAWNLIAIPTDKTFTTIGANPSLAPFTWELSGTPEEVDGFAPTSYMVLDTRTLDPWLIEDLEKALYGTETQLSILPPAETMLPDVRDWARFRVVDNGDGTWTGIEARPYFLTDLGDGDVRISRAVVTHLDDDTAIISDVINDIDVARVDIRDNGDGTFTASSDEENTIVQVSDEDFEIRQVELDLVGPDFFRISSQNYER